ncbi:MAG TPA: spore protease YyaC [Symbiobacteriaceae bacterium]|nr:spore protease YyaC [Symbiobacteriaceae bacterium]
MHDSWRGFFAEPALLAPEQRVHMDAPEATSAVAKAIVDYGSRSLSESGEIVLVCIGTDRSTGDALGPLVGSYLAEQVLPGCSVFGTLDNPVHATNLADTMDWIDRNYRDPLVMAVDACLGRVESVGYLTVGSGSLKPGAAVNKTLPEVGQVYVTGIVNVGGFMEFLVLQNTRLSLVYRMAKVAAVGIAQGVQALVERRPVASMV